MKYDVKLCEILHKAEIAEGIFDYTVSAPELAVAAKPGQFAHILVPGHTLRRPISICGIDKDAGTLRFVFQIRGAGTEKLAGFEPGDSFDILGPLGNGFPVEQNKGKKALFVGGGIGVPPLLGAAKAAGAGSVAALGFRSKNAVILEDDFKAAGVETRIATDDGSYGTKGVVTALMQDVDPGVIYACGPMVMLRAVKEFAAARNIPCYISLEERMACGVGACLGCAVELYGGSNETYMGHVCKDGPVFAAERVVL